MRRALLLSALLLAGAPEAARAQPPAQAAPEVAPADPARMAEARKLLGETGSLELAAQMLTALRAQMVQIIASGAHKTQDEAARIVDEVLMPAMRANLPKLGDGIVTIWATNFSLADLRGLEAFYATPLGRRLAAAQPTIAQQSLALGRSWGEQTAREAIEANAAALRAKGVQL